MKIKHFSGSFSQINQESFVLSALNEKQNGFYVEIGAFDATQLSNTYLLETKYNWTGVSLEVDHSRAHNFNSRRKNPCIAHDAMTFDFEKYFIENNFPKQIDYLQVDIEPPENTLRALLNMPMNYRYSTITFEHDIYYGDIKNKIEAKEFLESHGYQLVVEDAGGPSFPMEDWFIDPTVVSW